MEYAYNDAYILVRGDITVAAARSNEKLPFR